MEDTPSFPPAPSGGRASQTNRRRHSRFPCEGRAEVTVPHGGMLFRGKILDISVSGCFIETAHIHLERGTAVEVNFVVRQMPFRVAGHIAVLHPKRGAGIVFQEAGPRRARLIADLIAELEEAKTGRKGLHLLK